MKVINGTNAVLGRLAVYAVKEALKGEEIAIVNCENIIITGNKKDIIGKIRERKTKIGSGQQGPKHSHTTEKLVKRAIRGMIPNHREGRGKEAFKRIKCYAKIPEEFKNAEMESFEKLNKRKASQMSEVMKWIKG